MKNKHLTFEERIFIEENLDKGISVNAIAKQLNRPSSTIVREIKRNAYQLPSSNIPCAKMNSCDVYFLCGDKFHCRKTCCNCLEGCKPSVCPEYVPRTCDRLKKSPFVCNGCSNCYNTARFLRFKYRAKHAQLKYLDTLKDSRSGMAITPEQLEAIDDLVSPLLRQGQSIRAIYMTHKDEIPCSEGTLYNYIDHCYLTARNIDLPRKVRFKKRYSHGNDKRSLQEFVVNRTYQDFKDYIEQNPDLNIWEMDTVIGTEFDRKCLLTLLYRKTNLMLIILLPEHTQECVINALNSICNTLGINVFQKLFQVILTDRGIEFGNPYAIECDEYGEIKTRVFYCDSYCSWQKGSIERNHEFIREILPKGKSFNNLSQSAANLIMSHINSYPREGLNNCSPYELSKVLLGKEFLEKMNICRIHPDDVILKPYLLYRNK